MGDLNQVVISGAVAAVPIADNGKKAGLNFKVYQELKSSVHRDLLNKIDVEKVATMRDERTRSQALAVIQDLVANLQTPLSGRERAPVVGSSGRGVRLGPVGAAFAGPGH